jgi:hypothetical protein
VTTFQPTLEAGNDFSGYGRLYECSECAALVRCEGKERHAASHEERS